MGWRCCCGDRHRSVPWGFEKTFERTHSPVILSPHFGRRTPVVRSSRCAATENKCHYVLQDSESAGILAKSSRVSIRNNPTFPDISMGVSSMRIRYLDLL